MAPIELMWNNDKNLLKKLNEANPTQSMAILRERIEQSWVESRTRKNISGCWDHFWNVGLPEAIKWVNEVCKERNGNP